MPLYSFKFIDSMACRPVFDSFQPNKTNLWQHLERKKTNMQKTGPVSTSLGFLPYYPARVRHIPSSACSK